MNIATKKKICFAILVFGQNRQLTPEAKYFLIRIVYLYGDAWVEETVEDLAGVIGLSKSAVTKARLLLSDLGYVKVNPVVNSSAHQQKIGRPRLVFRIEPNFLDNILPYEDQRPIVAFQENHPELLKKLLFWSNKGDVLRARNVKKLKRTEKSPQTQIRHTFTVATRLLLAVLYSHADPCGVVIKLGLSRLSRLIGISRDRLESQLGIIKNLGYLIDRVSGVTGKSIFGRATGSFYMNVSVDDCQVKGSFTLAVFYTDVVNFYNQRYWGFRITQEAKNLSFRRNYHGSIFSNAPFSNLSHFAKILVKSVYPDDPSINGDPIDWSKKLDDLLTEAIKILRSSGLYSGKYGGQVIHDATDFFNRSLSTVIFSWLHVFFAFQLHDFLYESLTLDFSKFLQSRIDRYAALILNGGWQKIEVEKLVIVDDLLSHIAADLFPKPLEGKCQESTRRSALALFFYCIAYQHALMVKGLILTAKIVPELSTNDQCGCSFAILPPRVSIDHQANQMTIAVRGGLDTQRRKFYGVRWTGTNLENIQMEKFSESHDEAKYQTFFRELGYDIATLQRMPE